MNLKSEAPKNLQKKESPKKLNLEREEKVFGLDAQTSQQIKDWSSAWLQNFYNNPVVAEDDSERVTFNRHPVEISIANIVGESDSLSEGVYRQPYAEGIAIFLYQLIDFIKIKSDEQSDSKKLDTFLDACKKSMFSWSPDITESLDLASRLVFVARANRVLEMKRFEDKLEGEMVYDLNFSNKHLTNSIIEKTQNLSVPEKLDLIYHLGKIGKYALYEGDVAIDAVNNVEYILQELSTLELSPLVKFALELAFNEIRKEEALINEHDQIEEEEQGQSDEAEKYEVEKEKLKRESLCLKTQIVSDKNLEGEFLRVASDAVGIFDRNLIPRQIGKVNFDRITTSREIIISIINPDMQLVHFSSYFGLSRDREMVPFGNDVQDEKLTLLIQYLHEPKLKNLVETDLGINLSEIPLRSQIHLLRFLSGQNAEGFDRLRNVLQKHPEISNKILNSFLAVAEDIKYSEYILKLAETLDKETADAVFSKYSEIAQATEQVRQLTPEQNNEVIRNLLHKGNELLKTWAVTADKVDSKSVLEQLENIKAEILLFASTFKVLSQHESIGLTDLQGSSFEIKDSSLLSGQEKQTMERIFIENRPKYPPKLLDETFREFTEALKTGGHEFQILRFNGEIVAFIRFDQLDDDNIYGGSLNVRSEVQNLAIGSAMLRATLNEKAKRFNIKAVVYEKNPMFDKYINDYGFEKGEAIENYRNTGEKFFKIEIKRRQ